MYVCMYVHCLREFAESLLHLMIDLDTLTASEQSSSVFTQTHTHTNTNTVTHSHGSFNLAFTA